MRQQGLINPLVIVSIVLGVFTLGLGIFSIWSYVNYVDQRDNVDAKVAVAVKDAQAAQKAADDKDFEAREKLPTKQITGPEDLGKVSVSYPKTWSVYLDQDGSNGRYNAYFYPGVVPSLNSSTPYALRLSVVDRDYNTVLAEFQGRVTSGDLKASTIAVQGVSGVRLDGKFTSGVEGAMVVLKVRDKTIQVSTEDEQFLADFNDTVIKSLTFNK